MKTQTRKLFGKIIVSIVFSGIAVFCSFQAYGAEWSDAQKEILNLEKKYWECIKNADVETMKKLLHDKIVSMRFRMSDPDNKPEEIDFIRRWVNYWPLNSYEIEPLAIQIFDNVAIACFNYKFAGHNFSDSGRVTHTWVKQNNTWYLIGLMEASYESLPVHY